MKHLTKEQRSRVQELHHAGRSTRDIATELGRSLDQIRYALKKFGLKPSRGSGGACYRNADLVLRLASEGATLSEIGRQVGSHHMKVRAYLRRHQIPYKPWNRRGSGNPSWKGGRMTDKDGYILVLLSDHPQANRHGYVREHRLVMEQKIGRFLSREEVVHHKDNDPGNNDPENLELFENNGKHLAVTRVGQCPNWTDEGFQRIQERWSRLSAERLEAIRLAKEQGGPLYRETDGRFQARPGTTSQSP